MVLLVREWDARFGVRPPAEEPIPEEPDEEVDLYQRIPNTDKGIGIDKPFERGRLLRRDCDSAPTSRRPPA